MKCPACDSEKAYIGFNHIDCPNKECKFYNEEYALELINKELASLPPEDPPQQAPDNTLFDGMTDDGQYPPDYGTSIDPLFADPNCYP